MDVLLGIKDINDAKERQQQWLDQIDTILDHGKSVSILAEAAAELNGHDYFLCTTSDYVLCYVAEYVARKGSRFTKFGDIRQPTVCDECLKTLVLGMMKYQKPTE